MALLEVKGLTKAYDQLKVVDTFDHFQLVVCLGQALDFEQRHQT